MKPAYNRMSCVALNGLRVSGVTGADIGALGLERRHRTITITHNGGKVVATPADARHRKGDRPGRQRTLRRPIFLTPDARQSPGDWLASCRAPR